MSQLTLAQRYTILVLLKENRSKPSIAKTIGVSKTTIYREFSRNKDERSEKYNPDLAQRKTNLRHKTKKKHKRFTPEIQAYAEHLIKTEQYSPEQVSGFMKSEGQPTVSHETLYIHIWKDKKHGGDLHTHLRRQGRKNRKRGNKKDTRGIIKDRISIDKRPERVERREIFGDLEVDLIIGKNHKGAIVTINDRASGMLKMQLVESKESKVVTKTIISLLEDWNPYILSMTADNGKEFAGHKEVSKELCIDYYFAHPYHSWERGSNENLNGLIRQYIPKKTDFSNLTIEFINRIESKLNRRPRKRFNYKNPIFVMDQLLFNSKVAFIG